MSLLVSRTVHYDNVLAGSKATDVKCQVIATLCDEKHHRHLPFM